jgi:YggT family protein
MLPDLGGIDISPIVLLLALQFLKYLIVYYAAPLFL